MFSSYALLPIFAAHIFAHRPYQPHQPLQYSVFINPPVPVVSPPQNYPWSPTAFTLIHGPSTAILVDAPITINSSNALADWIEATIPGKKLTHNYITHGHGDHFFGAATLQQRFPGLKVVATKRTIAHINEQLEPDMLENFWEPLFPDGQIPVQNVTFEALHRNHKFFVDGYVVRSVEVGQSDTYNTTVLHVPSLDLVVAGDVVYGNCFQYLVESNTTELRHQWINAISEVEKLKPKIVVPSHMQESEGFGVEHLEKTKEYIRTWGTLAGESKSADDLIAKVKKAYPERVGDFILEISAQEVFPTA